MTPRAWTIALSAVLIYWTALLAAVALLTGAAT